MKPHFARNVVSTIAGSKRGFDHPGSNHARMVETTSWAKCGFNIEQTLIGNRNICSWKDLLDHKGCGAAGQSQSVLAVWRADSLGSISRADNQVLSGEGGHCKGALSLIRAVDLRVPWDVLS